MAVSIRVPILAMILGAVGAGCLVCPLQAQIPVRDLQAFEGSWECRSPIGIAGVAIIVMTSVTEKGHQQDITSQSVDFRVYQRQGEQERGGYFSPGRGLDGSTVFDGKRLIIHFKDRTDIPPFDLDVRFDPTTQRWTGSFSLCDKSQDVVLERPRQREGVPNSAFVGDWQGGAAGTLHIRQGYDGGLTAWLDSTLSGLIHTEQRNGEQLHVVSATESTIALETISAGIPNPYTRYVVCGWEEYGRPMEPRRRL